MEFGVFDHLDRNGLLRRAALSPMRLLEETCMLDLFAREVMPQLRGLGQAS